MSRQLLAVSSMEDFTENALVEMAEMDTFIRKISRLTELLSGLNHAHDIQIANARKRVEAARADLRDAEHDLCEAEENGAQVAEIETEIVKAAKMESATLMAVSRSMAQDAKKLGWKHGRPELTECSPAEKATV